MSEFPLKIGSSGNTVKQAQAWLNLALEIKGSTERLQEDGKYGPKTAKVVKTYFAREEVSEADYKLAIKAVPAMKKRLAEIRQTGKNPDNLLQNLITSEQGVFENLLAIAQSYDSASEAQRARFMPQFQQAALAAERFNKRVQALKSQGEVIKIKSGKPSRLDGLAAKYVRGSVGGIGVFAVVAIYAVPAIAALIVGGTAVAVYDWLTPKYRESTTDFKVTKELRAVLDKLTPEDQKVILQTAEQQVDQAYNEGRRDENLTGGLFGGLGKTVKWVVIGGATAAALYFAAPMLQGARDNAIRKNASR